jgi:hypothetical protein
MRTLGWCGHSSVVSFQLAASLVINNNVDKELFQYGAYLQGYFEGDFTQSLVRINKLFIIVLLRKADLVYEQ